MDEYEVMERLGVAVVEVDELCREGSYVPGLNLAVVRRGLTPERREAIGVWLLARVLLGPADPARS
ncbi:hypothetical protein [Cellulomonas rhizosphaerae]|uniref:Uncharacterized protein n=1 Tax=Cellulomonas rhizosphaerae TaxID=2293719 RepID=A0A413RJC6_9CELL|nr:hypothetical protein [Cellulomonas rhizosphaerae]RHA38680.1 hypothetical protein D1825_13175 [Cellulomonas rhizosphaerae]